jgi:hypothetical protein
MLRAISDVFDACSSIILEAYTSAPYINADDSNITAWSKMGGKLKTNKTGIYLWTLHSQSSILRLKQFIFENFMWMNVLSHQAHMMLSLTANQDLLGELGILMNFNDQKVDWDTGTIPMKDRDKALFQKLKPLLRILWAQMIHKQ